MATATTDRLTVLHGGEMSADDAAWAMLADTADRAVMLPGLSPACASLMREMRAACRISAGLAPTGEAA